MILLIFLSVLLGTAFSSCPMQKAYEQGILESARIGAEDIAIAQKKLLVAPDDCGNVFFFQPPYPADANDDFNRTTTLLLAQQIFCSSLENPTAEEIREKLNEHSSCLPENQRCSTMPIKCPKDAKYRTIDGSCNNVKNPKWGKAFTPYSRLKPASFSDGVYEMRKSIVNKMELPGARDLSNNLFTKSPFTCHPEMHGNMAGVMYGQLIAHDLGMRQMYQTQEGGASRSCCNSDYTEPLSPQPYACSAIKYSKDDPYLSNLAPDSKFQCMNYIRSQMTFSNDCTLGGASAVNAVTHYLDSSPIYGSEESVASQLRTFEDGKMKTNKNNVLPETCEDPNEDCYLTGDFRGTAFFTLGILQSIYHRLHNIIADALKALNPKWNDERIFQEAKRLNTAIHQNVVYTEWLQVFVGIKETKQFRPIRNEYVGQYKSTVDGSATNEFSHCVFRNYHANLNSKLNLLNADYTVTKTFALEECDDGLKILEDRYDEVARALIKTPSLLSTFSAKVRNQMFNNNNKYNLGLDLSSTDILVGRDLGIQPYYIYFELCLKKKVRSWNDFVDTISESSVEDLKKIYKSFQDVDSYVGTALENRCGSYLGTVGKCMAEMQFERSRSGDRYFYSVSNGANPFTPAQLAFIYNFKYANVLCTTTGIRETPKNAFGMESKSNPMIPCKRGLDLKAWKEK